MMPTSRFALTIVLTMAMWAPTLRAGILGTMPLDAALIRYLAAFFAAHLASGWIAAILGRYTRPHTVTRPAGDPSTDGGSPTS